MFLFLCFLGVFTRYLLTSFIFDRYAQNQNKSFELSYETLKHDLFFSALSSLLFAFVLNHYYYEYLDGNLSFLFGPIFLGREALKLVGFLILHDLYYYIAHRLMHHRLLYSLFHATHHKAKIPHSYTSFSFHPLETLIQAAPLILFLKLASPHIVTLIVVLSFMSLFSLINHLGVELIPLRLQKIFIGSGHHQLHHRYYRGNYALYFSYLDYWFKTQLSEK